MAEIIYSLLGVGAFFVGTSATNQISNVLFSRASDRKYAQERFGTTAKFFAGTVFDVRQLRRMEEHVLQGSDEVIMDFKSSHLSSIGQTSVACVILAQLSMTTLQLPGLDSVHWTGPGFLFAGLLFSVVSVVTVCIQQQTLGMLNDANQVKLWLSTGQYSHDTGYGGGQDERATSTNSYQKPRLQASIAALVVLRIPNAFLSYAVLCYLTGVGLYLGFAYRQDLQNTPGRDNNEAVMIFYLIIAAYAIFQSAAATLWKLSESNYTTKVWEDDADESQNSGKNQRTKNFNERSPLLSSSGGSNGRNDEIREALQAMARAHEETAKTERRLMELLKSD